MVQILVRLMNLRIRPFSRHMLSFLYPPEGQYRGMQSKLTHSGDYLFVDDSMSTKKQIHKETVLFLIWLVLCIATILLYFKLVFGISPLVITSAVVALVYLAILIFKLSVVKESLSTSLIDFTQKEVGHLKNEYLPTYSIIVPLKYESKVIPQIVEAMTSIDYPTDKLEIIITLEEYDHETIAAVETANLPSHFRVLMLPDVTPKTKPRTLNVAIREIKGEFLVIYDAEIVPEPNQLKKAVLAFSRNASIGVLQTRLDHYNSRQSIITRLFNAEFSFHYDMFLPGLQTMGYPIPLSGHSTHFRTDVLKNIGAWDPYNVTEDCEIGIRLRRSGVQTGIINSVSYEEATIDIRSWILQRTRWMKGFVQTSIVHLRYPFLFISEIGGWKNFFAFLVVVPGTVFINIVNLLSFILLLLWFITGSEIIQALFPMPVLYISVASFLIGNFIFTYLNLIGSYKRQRYDLVKYSLLSPFYWMLLAIASVRAIFQMMTNPHIWEKTTHGTHLPDTKKNPSELLKTV